VPYLLAVDQSTSATKALIFDPCGNLLDKTSIEHAQYYPEPGWVEHDAEEIWANTIEACRRLLAKNRPLLAEFALPEPHQSARNDCGVRKADWPTAL
jgi:glycerol kinase